MQAVADQLISIHGSRRHNLKRPVAEMVQAAIEADVLGCGCLFRATACQHVWQEVAQEVLRCQYDAQHSRALGQHLLFEAADGRLQGFGFTERIDAVRTALNTLASLARESELNTPRHFDHTKVEDPDESEKKADGRKLGEGFDKWLLKDVVASLGEVGLAHVNRALAATFYAKPFSVTLAELPVAAPNRSWFDTKLYFQVETAAGESMSFSEPVNVKYESSSSPTHSNSGGLQSLASAMFGDGSKAWKMKKLIPAIEASLTLPHGTKYGQPEGDYWFWAFRKDKDDAPITEAFSSSLLSIDPYATSAVAGTDDSQDKTPLRFNGQQSFPHLQVHYEVASRSMRPPRTALEARDRLWNWLSTEHVNYLRETLSLYGTRK